MGLRQQRSPPSNKGMGMGEALNGWVCGGAVKSQAGGKRRSVLDDQRTSFGPINHKENKWGLQVVHRCGLPEKGKRSVWEGQVRGQRGTNNTREKNGMAKA
jgi:hypothetical protein